jgi:hypothetical protein
VRVFRHHSSRYDGDEPRWVAASGAIGLRGVTLHLGGDQERTFLVRLVFAEPEEIAAQQRVFSVQLQGKEVLSNFDIRASADAPRRTVVREFHGVKATEQLHVNLIPSADAPVQDPLLCGIEVIAESIDLNSSR